MQISLDKISVFFLGLFVLCISLDPTGQIFHLKEPLFIFLLFLSILNRKNIKPIPRDVLFVLFFCLILPVWGICISILKDSYVDSVYALGHLKSLLFIFIVFFLFNIDFQSILRVLFISGTVLAVITVILFVIAQLNDELFRLAYIRILEDSNIIISMRSYYGYSILGIYFKAGPIIFFSYIYSLYFLNRTSWRLLFIGLNLFALLIAGSRTPSLIAIFMTIIFMYDKMKFSRTLRCILAFILGLGLSILIYYLATEKGETSNEIKYGNFFSYIDNIFDNSNSIIGAGLGSVFMAEGRGRLISASEFTFLDIVRIYGLFLGLVFIFLVFYPAYKFYVSKYIYILKYKRFILAYIMYMVLAGTNPLLISSTGMFVWAMGLAFVYQLKYSRL